MIRRGVGSGKETSTSHGRGSVSCVTSDSSNPKPNLLVGEGERTRETAARPRERAMYCSSARGREPPNRCHRMEHPRHHLPLLCCSSEQEEGIDYFTGIIKASDPLQYFEEGRMNEWLNQITCFDSNYPLEHEDSLRDIESNNKDANKASRERERERELRSFENSYIPENPRTPPISYISQTVNPFKKPTSELFKTFRIIKIR
ncbi:hypothetical protein LXL04_028684 [Taraxacum kok-saghyz]